MRAKFLRLLPLLTAIVSGAASASPEEVIRAKLKAVMPDAEITNITPAPINGLYQVSSRNYEPLLATSDGRYLIQGDLLEIKGNRIVSVSDQLLAAERKRALAAVDASQMVIFPATGKMRSAVYVFTDVDCGYCRKFHNEVPELNKRGIEVRYLAYPRSGPNTVLASKLTNVWCAPDRRAAMTRAKGGAAVPASAPQCKSPVDDQYRLGSDLGVRGTPAIFDQEGMQLGGYLSADALAKALNLR